MCIPSVRTCSPACQNGGTCHVSSSSAHCDCPSGYTGSYCQTRGKYNQGHSCEQQLDHESHHACIACFWHAVTCTPACRNGGTCHVSSSSAHCDCPSGYTGSYCQNRGKYNQGYSCEQQLYHESHHACIACFWHAVTCTPACRNGGTCHVSSSSAHCDCPSGYTGSYCQNRGKHRCVGTLWQQQQLNNE